MEKTLIFSDIHLHPWRAFGLNLQSGLPKRLEEQKQVLEQILDLVKKEKIKVVVFGGDLFHKIGEIPVECLNIADWFFNKLREQEVDYWLAVGNHDIIDRSNPQWFENASRIWSRSREVSSAPFFIGNYFDSNEEIEKARGYELVVIHKTPMYAKINEYIFEEGALRQRLTGKID
jgi:DNA repair exonuclease SbcCD nuclease subunit